VSDHLDADPLASGLDITIRTGTGSARTPLAAFDTALLDAGVANFNLITLSSVIPPKSRVRQVDVPLGGNHGDRLYCVLSSVSTEQPGQTVWAGLGWAVDESTTGGLFVEHTGATREELAHRITVSLEDMSRNRGGGYDDIGMALTSATCVDVPVCALAIATYAVAPWFLDER
jgi:arginine decarboxylase